MDHIHSVIEPLLQQSLPSQPGDKRKWTQLNDSSLGLILAETAQVHSGLTVVICDTSQMAAQLERQLHFFLGHNSTIDILQLPDWETLPYDHFSPHQDIISERLDTLYRLPLTEQAILLIPVSTLLHRLAPKQFLVGNSLVVTQSQVFSLSDVRRQLDTVGYQCVDTVFEHGEYAVRGSIIDIFPMGSEQPFRIELFDEEIESLRTFDVESQRTIDQVQEIRLLPAHEFPLDKNGIKCFLDNWHEHFDVDHRHCPIYRDVSSGISSAGLEYYLPLFFGDTATLFDYLPDNTLTVCTANIEHQIKQFWQEIDDRYEQRCVDNYRPILPPQKVFIHQEELYSALKLFPRILISSNDTKASTCFPFSTPPTLSIDARSTNPLAALNSFLHQQADKRILFCAESAGRKEIMNETFHLADIRPTEVDSWQSFCNGNAKLAITTAPLDEGLISDTLNLAVIAESQLYGQRVMQRRRRSKATESPDAVIKNLTELRIGAPVVHIDHGVGRYQGLQRLTIDAQDNEFLTLEYADSAKLYVPVASLHLISRYTGADGALAPLHKLGNEQWQKAKRKAAEKIRDVAAELLDIYARRAARKGQSLRVDQKAYQQFSSAFPFEETVDQLNTINAVHADLKASTPMDRLVCGDVGFGKTEVAMRAAFIAVQAGKQVAILVPTTLLAQQHFETFRDRFADWPVNIEMISRFRSTKESNLILKNVQEGKVDIIIGTHKLIQGTLKFTNLGLVIIDEEHRFGVRQKEILKSFRSEVDILTLTATPIPRTLNMSMAGMRDLSIIATPPARRLSVKTFVRPDDKALIKEAVLREILRGGQVYYLHNEVNTIEKVAAELSELIPEARVNIGHGQMRERQLEQVMGDFYHQRFNVLVCTTIIETGIDVPNANTIIIHRADKFGLAQLHQLRGRVGRSHHQAYAYLLTPEGKKMTSDAQKRLEAIADASALGSGFTLATHDLEIRGAGELLGDEQSGQIQTIGFSLYMEMLDRAIEAIRSGKTPDIEHPLKQGSEINLRIPALIPDNYLPDVNNRLILYKRIANATNEDALQDLQIEMIDRFGLLPDPVKNLFRVTRLKIHGQAIGIKKIEASQHGGRLEFSEETSVDPMKIVQLVQSHPKSFQMEGAATLAFKQPIADTELRLSTVEQLIKELSNSKRSAA